ncbi:UNKNOWN [Stylonychia lemnae]|uniref:Uncharacterized protein n=1 Tax=Stylonychia lemnae TaxID=5949 RepID=A0A078ATH3_STYLE|nr:UNKNOWN [Stylonychia lemnae]|eukprot:CDW85529.1 UNKNOWN [Stylonychia lemnae]
MIQTTFSSRTRTDLIQRLVKIDITLNPTENYPETLQISNSHLNLFNLALNKQQHQDRGKVIQGIHLPNQKSQVLFNPNQRDKISVKGSFKTCLSINTLNCLQQSTNNNRIISHQNIPSSVSNNLQYQSVREILFQHSQKRSKERQVVNQDSKLKQKYFKMFKQYVKLKLKVRIFLSDEIENLNREFDKLLVQNKYLLNENQKYKKYCETSLLETHVNTKRTFQLGQTLMKIYENNKKTNQSDFLKEFKIIKKREQAILSLIKLKTNTSKLKAFLKWRGLLNELKRPRSNLTTISQITMKPPKHQNNQTPNDLSTCPNSMIKTQQSSGFISKSQSQKRFDNGSNENTQFVQDMSALHMFPQRLSLNSRQDSQKRRSVSSKRDKSQNSDKSCCVITTKQQNRCHSRQSMMSDDKNPGTRDTSQNQNQKDQPKRFFDQKMLQKLQRIQQLDKETSKDRKSVPQQTTEQLFKPAKTLNILEKHKYQQSSHKEMRQSIKFERSISNLKGASSNNVSSSQLSIQGILQKLGNQPQSNISSSRHGETHQSNNKTFEPTEMDLSSTNLIISSQMNHLQNFSISEYNMESMICQMKNVINNQKAEFQKPKAKDLKERLKESIFTPQYNHCNRVLSAKQVGANKVEDYELKRAIIDKENINTNNIGDFQQQQQSSNQEFKEVGIVLINYIL